MGTQHLHNLFMISEGLVNPEKKYGSSAWSMWIDLNQRRESRLELMEVNSEDLWIEMFNLRSKIEKDFGDFSSEDIIQMISAIKIQVRKNDGRWFLAYFNKECIGEIGVIPIKDNGKLVYRLQDVDIIQSHRGLGLGNDLLNSISNLALDQNVKSLCLMADTNDWKKDWYLRYGFFKIGEVG